MDESFSEICLYRFKRLIPLLSSVILLLLFYVPVHVPFSPFLRPDIGVTCVFFWSLYRQDLFNVFSAFLLGIVADSLSAVPLGLNTFIYLFIFVLCSAFGLYINLKPFLINWIGFAVVSFLAFFLKWILSSFYFEAILSFDGIFISYLATVLMYPLFARLNMFLQNRYLTDEENTYE